ncbi:MAG TPA: hypothetical protein VES66_05365 [Terriglobales bacterium]|nr:hypothetical protein [Terriglobales bacterium]
MNKKIRDTVLTAAAVMLWFLPAAAQVEVGEDVKLNLSGNLSFGYTGTTGDFTSSGHGLSIGGNSDLHGYYYNPQFLSFDIQPYYNRSQSNSTFQSITDSSGVTATANLFSGSHFPGSITYAHTSDSTGQFGIPGVTGLSTEGSGQSFTIAWGEAVPNLPTLNASFSLNGQDASVPGANTVSHSASRNFTLNSDYLLKGFRLHGFFTHMGTDGSFPGFLAGTPEQDSSVGSNSYGIQASHPIPLHGFWSAGVSRSTFGGDFWGGTVTGSNEGSNDMFSTGVTLNPMRTLGLGLNLLYQSNAFGAVQQQLLQAGGTLPAQIAASSADALSFNGSAYYTFLSHFGLTAQFNHQEQYFNGGSLGFTQYGGGIFMNYAHRLLGSLNFSVGANDTATQAGNSGASLYGNVNFARRVQGWDLGANFNYSQAVQSLVAVYTTSLYGYGASARRRFGNRMYWTNYFNASHSGMAQTAGSSSHAESFSTSITYRRYTLVGLFSQSAGTAILTAQGLVPVPIGVPPSLLPGPVLYSGTSYGGGGSATLGRLSVSLNYLKATSDTTSVSIFSNNGTSLLTGRLGYRVRKLYLDAGFTRFGQSVSAAGVPPGIINSYYVGVSRWFKVF